MENNLTAEQAKELTAKSKKTNEEIMEGIKSMAQSGYNYWAAEPTKVNAENAIKYFEPLGYNILSTESTFRISW